MNEQKRVILIICDGWGIGDHTKSDAIFCADTPNFDRIIARYPNASLLTNGENVGLPDGQMGNSEVGHMNIGAGRIVYQDLVRINLEVRNNNISKNPVIQDAFSYARQNDKALHFIGLVSDGGVHSLNTHLYKLCDITKEYGLKKVFIHAITDGRDCDPRSGLGFIRELQDHLQHSNGVIASLAGRYYPMDRDKRWERIKKGYDLYVHGTGKKSRDILQSIRESYEQGITDEFIEPIVMVNEKDEPVAKITAGDVVFCFNFRTDRLRELTTVLSQKDMPEAGMMTIPLYYVTMANYDESFHEIKVAYDKYNLVNTLGEIISKKGMKQIRIAETEKYPHVTFFFSGGREEKFENESRIMIPSPKVATYDLQPEMSAFLVKDAINEELKKQEVSFVCLNFANCDMVGHTGVYDAILKAVNAVDKCVGSVVETALANGYIPIITADHGNADYAINPDGSPNTAHSLNPVPFILVSDNYQKVENGILADLAPTILKIMGLDIPPEMTGRYLIK
ncbi:MAG: 2,3-bisphosphoglycerate-independent phosphoglycerate mutase [Bacteroidia bacterium]|nr:2,3-bisphosphoglycerate-independent phosphoglycerate mutase [Bacteroidia bacterium]